MAKIDDLKRQANVALARGDKSLYIKICDQILKEAEKKGIKW